MIGAYLAMTRIRIEGDRIEWSKLLIHGSIRRQDVKRVDIEPRTVTSAGDEGALVPGLYGIWASAQGNGC
jgi:hypothetical protein